MRGYEEVELPKQSEEKKDPHSLFDVQPDDSEKQLDQSQKGGGG